MFSGSVGDRSEDDEELVGLLLGTSELSSPIVLVTGQTVVVSDISSVVTCPVGQLVTVGGQDVTV